MQLITDIWLVLVHGLPQGPPLPEGILKYVLSQIAKVVPHDQDAKTLFVTSGSFAKMQEIAVEAGSEIKELIDSVNSAYPIEIVHYYSPGYSEILLQKLTSGKFWVLIISCDLTIPYLVTTNCLSFPSCPIHTWDQS